MLNAIGNFLGVILGFIVNIVGDYAWSIIIFTILVRLCLMPLMIKQIKSTKAMQDIQPKMQEIQEKYMPEVRQTHNITLYNFTTSIATTSKQIPTNKYFLFFGRLSYEKGVKTLLKAFKELPECNLKIVGTGPKEKELKLFVSNNSMNNVEFLGYKRGLELIDLVKNAYSVIVPSEWYENNPMTIIEAYSVGTPVIGAKIGGIPEIIIDGKTGYQFTTGNSDNLQETIKKIFSLTPEAYQRLSAGTLEFAHENLSLENYYPRLIAFYSHFLKQE